MTTARPIRDEDALSSVEGLREGLADISAGRVFPWAEVRRWIASWGKPDELPPPAIPGDPAGAPKR